MLYNQKLLNYGKITINVYVKNMASILQKKIKKIENLKKNNFIEQRNQSIKKLSIGDSSDFIEFLEKRAINEKGEKIEIFPWTQEYASLIADGRISQVSTTGSAQIGKSLFNALLKIWLVGGCNLNCLYIFATQSALNRMVDVQFKPIYDIFLKEKKETKNKQIIQANGGTGIFSYAGVNSRNIEENATGRAAASNQIISFSCDWAFCDERSQYAPGVVDPIYRRLDNSRLPSKPIRFVGTPGSGQGIEKEIENNDFNFYPYTICKSCESEIKLDPFELLFKPKTIVDENGKQKQTFLSETGKPLDWNFENENEPLSSSYFACPHCHNRIDDDSRLNHSFFKCLNTEKYLIDFLNNFENENNKRIKVGITLSPLLRKSSLNLPQEIIQSGLDSSNPIDWQQQKLGIPSQGQSSCLSITQIEKCLNTPQLEIHSLQETITCAGIDQGRGNDFLIIIKYVLPLRWEEKSYEEIIKKTARVVLFGEPINRKDIPQILSNFDCNLGIIDNEPNISTAVELAQTTGLEIADQKPNQLSAIKKSIASDGGEQFPCWGIRSSKFLKQVKDCFYINYDDGYPLARLPANWENWLNFPSEISPIRHLTSVSYDPSTGRFERPIDHNDDMYFAWMFCEVSFYLNIVENQNNWASWFKYIY